MNDPLARLSATPLTRRRFLQGSGLVGISAFLAACVGGGASGTPATSGPPAASPTAPPTPTPAPTGTPKVVGKTLHFANWTAYIDLAGKAGEAGGYAPGSSPTLEGFKKKYSVDVDYQEKIDANPSFIATIQPALNNGLATGWDLIVLTDSFAAQLIGKGWIEALDHANTPNAVQNLRAPLKGVSWDPDNNYHFPWQSGMTGVGYSAKALSDAKLAVPTKIADLWNIPSNKVTFLEEARDTFGLTLLKLGIDPNPDTVTTDDLQKVHDAIQPLVDAGLRFTGNSYLQDFGQKKVWAAMVWSGDLASSGEPDDKFVFPEEGTMIWTDNMLIPKGAANKYAAELMMDYVYDPKIAAQIADYVYYVSPVEGAAEAMKTLDPSLLTNPLVFPPADVIAKQKNFQFLKPEIEQKMNELFGQLAGA